MKLGGRDGLQARLKRYRTLPQGGRKAEVIEKLYELSQDPLKWDSASVLVPCDSGTRF